MASQTSRCGRCGWCATTASWKTRSRSCGQAGWAPGWAGRVAAHGHCRDEKAVGTTRLRKGMGEAGQGRRSLRREADGQGIGCAVRLVEAADALRCRTGAVAGADGQGRGNPEQVQELLHRV